jgi:hypothetical protein
MSINNEVIAWKELGGGGQGGWRGGLFGLHSDSGSQGYVARAHSLSPPCYTLDVDQCTVTQTPQNRISEWSTTTMKGVGWCSLAGVKGGGLFRLHLESYCSCALVLPLAITRLCGSGHRLWTSLPRTGSVSHRGKKKSPQTQREKGTVGQGRGGAGGEGVICLSSVGRC